MRRELGFIETTCALGHGLFAGAGQFFLAVEVSGPLTPALVHEAVGALQRRHPLLRARIERGATGFVFDLDGPPPAIAVTVQQRTSDADWIVAAERSLAQPLDAAVALWRIDLLLGEGPAARHVIVLTMHHAMADGCGATRVVDDLLDLCAARLRGQADDGAARPVPPAIEGCLAPPATWDEYVAATRSDSEQHRMPAPALFVEPAPVAARIPRLEVCTVNAAMVADLRGRANTAGTTVNAAIAAAMMLAVERVEGRRELSLATSVDLRGRAAPALPLDVACHMTNVRTCHAWTGGARPWELARAYHEQLRRRAQAQARTPASFSLDALAGRFDRETADRSERFPHGLGLSNLGIYRHPARRGEFTLHHAALGTSRRAGFYVGFLHVVTLAGRMSLSFCHVEPLVDRDRARAYLDGVVDALRRDFL